MPDTAREMLRHTVAALAYRTAKTVRGAPDEFAGFQAGGRGRSAVEILAHMGDLFDWALSMAKGEERWTTAKPLAWEAEVARLFAALSTFDAYLESDAVLHAPAERLFQGPVADALTHAGQIALMRRMAGSPVTGENYFAAEIKAGRVGLDQSDPKHEF